MSVKLERKSSKTKGRWGGSSSAGLSAALLVAAVLAHLLVQPVAQAGANVHDGRQSTARSSASAKIEFLSPDRRVWCYGISGGVSCAGHSGSSRSFDGPYRSAFLSSKGRISICEVEESSLTEGCWVNFGDAPILARGRWVQVGDVRCVSARDGIACLRVRGPRRGVGFRINAHEAVKVKRHLSPRHLTIPTSSRHAFFKPACGQPARCSAQVTIGSGGKILARGAYSIPAHSSRKVAIPLTAAGRTALTGKSRVGAKLTIVDTRSGRRESIPVVLRG